MADQGFTFPRTSRLLNASDFSRVFKHCEFRAASKHLLLLSITNPSHSRLGLIIAKKHVRLAAQRNRVKRIIREHFRLSPPNKNIDAVVLARPGLADLSNDEIRRALATLWQKIERQGATT